jgi:branched-chain amino acid transport system ATP-binding protein
MLRISNVSSSHGKISAVRDVSLEVGASGIVALIGANGAGKSTTLRTIVGLHRASSGRIEFDGVDITKWNAHKIVRRGLTLVPEGRMVIAPLSVEENLALSSFAGRGDKKQLIARVYDLFPRLKERRKQLSGLLSGGEQQMLALGRGLMTDPSTLLLDEPSMGLSPLMVELVLDSIEQIGRSGLHVLLVEQNAVAALAIASHAYVLRRGEIVASGSSAEVMASAEVRSAYLG